MRVGAATASSESRLTPLQHAVLRAFFAREKGYVLTGGAALAGYHLRHRSTGDLQLFTVDANTFERGRFVLEDVAHEVGGTLEIVQQAPGFLRTLLSTADDVLVVDLVRDRSFQLKTNKLEVDGVLVDPPEEILANKLTAIVGRAEERDLVDVMLLERYGLRIEDVLDAALKKDGGCTPATLAWLLSEVKLGSELRGDTEVSVEELREWLASLIVRLRAAALPKPLS